MVYYRYFDNWYALLSIYTIYKNAVCARKLRWHPNICLLWPQILILKLTGPGNPNSRLLYGLSDGTTPVDFPIMCNFYDLFE